MKRVFSLSIISILCSSCTSYYYVVRHANRLNNSFNPPLSTDGFTRATALRYSLSSKGIDYIFASTFLRTQQTAEPTATTFNKSLTIYLPDTTNGLITALKRINGKDKLVVGHSNNVPAIVTRLSGQSVPAIALNDFDNLYIIRIKKSLTTSRRLWHKTYGVASP